MVASSVAAAEAAYADHYLELTLADVVAVVGLHADVLVPAVFGDVLAVADDGVGTAYETLRLVADMRTAYVTVYFGRIHACINSLNTYSKRLDPGRSLVSSLC